MKQRFGTLVVLHYEMPANARRIVAVNTRGEMSNEMRAVPVFDSMRAEESEHSRIVRSWSLLELDLLAGAFLIVGKFHVLLASTCMKHRRISAGSVIRKPRTGRFVYMRTRQ